MKNFAIDEIRHWCYKVLPLVYDDSLSYYEVICKVSNKLNEVIESVNGIPEYIAELISEEKLRDIIDIIFSDLRKQITSADEGSSTTATADRGVGALVWLNDYLYRVTKPMDAGDRYIVGSNIEKITIEKCLSDEAEVRKSQIKVLDDAFSVTRTETEYAPSELNGGQLIWIKGHLYRVSIATVPEGTKLIDGVNVEKITVEKMVSDEAVKRIAGDAKNAEDILTEAENRRTADEALQEQINNIETSAGKRRFIFVSDSYGESPSLGEDWITRVISYSHLTGAYRAHVSGGSFGGPVKLLDALRNIESSVSEPTTITDIVVGCGYNEIGYIDGIVDGMHAFATYCGETYPNATVHLAMISLTKNNTNEQTLMHNVLNYYKQACIVDNIHFIEGSEYMFHRYDQLGSDGIHPTTFGSQTIGVGMSGFVKGGSVIMPIMNIDSIVCTASGIMTSANYTWSESDCGDSIKLVFGCGLASFSAQQLTGSKEIGSFVASRINGATGNRCAFTVPVMAFNTLTNAWECIPGKFILANGKVYFNTTALNTYNQLYMSEVVVNLPKSDC